MRHSNQNRTLSRPRNQRTALLRSLAVSLIKDGQVRTTLAKAKELRPFVERLVTYGKRGTVDARRRVSAQLGEPKQQIVKQLFEERAQQYTERQGGYTRIIKAGRKDGREEAVIEFV